MYESLDRIICTPINDKCKKCYWRRKLKINKNIFYTCDCYYNCPNKYLDNCYLCAQCKYKDKCKLECEFELNEKIKKSDKENS